MPDAFDILGVRPAFDLSRDEVAAAYLPLASRLHPDLAAGSEEAARQMADINRARAALENPESRADILLKRLGGPAAEKEKSLPEGFLAEILGVREEIEAALSNAGGSTRSRAIWERWSQDQRGLAISEVSTLFASFPVEPGLRAQALKQLRIKLNAWRYIERLIEQLDPARG